MKKINILCFLLLCTIYSKAEQPLKVGVTAGVNFNKYQSADLDYLTGFNIGVKGDYKISNIVFLTSSLNLTKKGGKTDEVGNLKMEAYYLELPIHIGLKQKLSGNFNLYEQFGPYLAYGLFGKIKQDPFYSTWTGDIDGFKTNTFSKNRFDRFDFGLGFKLGVEYKEKIQFSLGTDFGLYKPYKESDVKNFNFNIALAYMFSL